MPKFPLMLSVALVAIATPALAQQPGPPSPESAKPANDQGNQAPGTTDGSGSRSSSATRRGSPGADSESNGDIIVTATRRSEALSDVPLAVSAVTAASLQNSGASDIRALNQLSPSLLVSSTSSEAVGGGARIRGIGTVGDNPGLESSVATFIDGVYRSRSGVGLTELGAIDRIEILRGPQGTLFGRNASAGLISIITAKPSFTFGAQGEATLQNYSGYRFAGGVTGPITDKIAARIDGVYFKRDGFLRDVISGRQVNNRDRYLVRGQLLFQPNDDFSFRLIGDYAKRKEKCCGAVFLPTGNVLPGTNGGFTTAPNSIVTLERALGAVINDNPLVRNISITPGTDFRGDVEDAGVSGELNVTLGNVSLTSITAYRDFRLVRGQDADFNNLDILHRLSNDAGGGQRQSFETFTQELRLQGTAFDDHLDYLVGGFYADEKLKLRDNLAYGSDYEKYSNCLLISGVLPSALSPASPSCINQPLLTGAFLATRSPTLGALLANSNRPGFGSLAASIGQPSLTLNGISADDRFRQSSRNYAFFTHNVIRFTDAISLTLGARYTNEKKTLDATLTDNNVFCRAISATPLAGFATLPCVIPAVAGGSYTQTGATKRENKVTGTAILSVKPADGLLVYASFSRGYKAGGFNLDRSGLGRQLLSPTVVGPINNADLNQLTFDPELVDAFELGYKLNKPGFDLNIAAFYQKFKSFQLNTFNGLNFVVINVNACKTSLNGGDTDNNPATGACASNNLKSGVHSAGLEIEAFTRPAPNIGVNLGLTYANTFYQRDLVGTNGAPLITALFQLPGQRLSNSSEFVATGSFSWTPPLGATGLSGLFYVDGRLQSDTNTGSDLDVEKLQDAFALVNARVGIRGPKQAWALELFTQNVFNTTYQQVGFDAPLQGSGTTRAVQRGFIPSSNQVYGSFLGEPRTYGVTARVKF